MGERFFVYDCPALAITSSGSSETRKSRNGDGGAAAGVAVSEAAVVSAVAVASAGGASGVSALVAVGEVVVAAVFVASGGGAEEAGMDSEGTSREGMGEDEAFVFEVKFNGDKDASLTIVDDDKVVDEVFKEYNRLLDEEEENN